MKFEAVIFDMDGLLIDSEPLWREAEVEVFKTVGIDLTDEMMMDTMGLRVDEVVKYRFEHDPWEGLTQREVSDQVVKKVIELIEKNGEAKPGVQNVFEVVSGLGVKVALASSSYDPIIQAVVQKLGVASYLHLTYSAQHEPYGKPHPGVYITTAEKLGVDPSVCLAFEDSVNGLIAAKAAKMKCVAVPDAFVKGRKEFAIADSVISTLDLVTPELLNELFSQ